MIDLHLHSSKSDGQLAPLDLAKHLAGLDCQAFAITDHNYLSPDLVAVNEYATTNGIQHFFGLEISSIDGQINTPLHILGYGLEFDFEEINSELAPVRDGYNRRARKIVEKLNHKYPNMRLDYEHMLAESGSAYLDRNRLAHQLQRHLNDGRTIKELLPEIYVEESSDWLPDTIEAIELITDYNGLAVLAHPGRLLDSDPTDFLELIGYLVNVGLVGIEAFYASHTPEQTEALLNIAAMHNLLVTGGSDWHGPDYSPHIIPGCDLSKKHLAALIKKFAP